MNLNPATSNPQSSSTQSNNQQSLLQLRVLFTSEEGDYSYELKQAALAGACIIHKSFEEIYRVIPFRELGDRELAFIPGTYCKCESHFPIPCHQSIPVIWIPSDSNTDRMLMPYHKFLATPWKVDPQKLDTPVITIDRMTKKLDRQTEEQDEFLRLAIEERRREHKGKGI